MTACGGIAADLAAMASPKSESTASAASGSEAVQQEVTIKSLNGSKQTVELTVPYDPQRVAVLDMASLDILDALNLGDRVVGSADTSLDYLQSYVTDEAVANLGTIKEADLEAVMACEPDVIFIGGRLASSYDALSEIAPVVYLSTDTNLGTIKEADLEAVMACEPDVIFIGGRLASSYDALSEIAPVVYLSTDTELGVVESVRKNTETIASIFDRQEQAGQLMTGFDARIEALRAFAEGKTAIVGMVTSGSYNVLGNELMTGFDARIEALRAFAEGKTAIVGMVTSGSYNVLGNDGRCSIIGREIGFENVGVDAAIDTSTHGNEASFEFLVEKDPQYIFVMDGFENVGVDAAIDTSTHGNEASFEFLVEKDPQYIFVMDRDAAIGTDGAKLAQEIMDNELVNKTQAAQNGHVIHLASPAVYIFVMDRDAAIGTDGAKLAQEIMDNELVNKTQAAQNGHVIHLASPAVWYTAEGGVTALDRMLSDLETGLGVNA